jgi:4-hydroxybutyryl-CoA dehydratase/vinylacetyl-CoA-Delta-isomerase
MAVKARDDYLAALKKLRPNIYKFGELIEDVTTHPATKRTVESHARSFDAANDPVLEKMYTAPSVFTGEKIMRWNSMMQDSGALIQNMRFKRQNYRRTGTCSGAVCVGWNAMNVMWAVTEEMDAEFGTDYKARLKNWILHAEREGLTVSGALTDAKGDRSKSPSQQADPDTNLRVVEVREDGIVIRGAKLMICGTAAAQEIFLLPGGAYKEPDKDYALACVVPRDIDGLTIVEARHPSDKRELEDTSDVEVPDTGITQGWLLFDNVLVPNERVFMCREAKYSSKVIQYFTANYRACIGGCVTGQGDVMIGASILMARVNGLKAKTFMNKLVDMSINNTITFGLGAGACALGFKHDSLTQEIGGGIVETGCMPSYTDVSHPEYGSFLKKCLKAGACSAESRFKAARLSEWLTIGAGVPGCMHGGGSPDGAKLVIRFTTPMEEYVEYARKIMDIEEEITES